MKMFMKNISRALILAAFTFTLFGCDMLTNLLNGGEGSVTKPSLYSVEPEEGTTFEAGSLQTIKFKSDGTEQVRISYQGDPDGEELEEIEYELITKKDGKFEKRIRVPLKAKQVELWVTGSDGNYYSRQTWTVTGTKSFGSYTTPGDYAKAYGYRTEEPHALAETIVADADLEATRKSDPLQYVIDVCERINEATEEDFLKAKIIHDILTLLIPYDMEGVNQSPMPAQDFWTVLQNKKGVCQGYALCYQKFCEVAGIDCEYIFGWNRSATHAWNVVRLDGKCYLLDCTWDAGREVGGEFKKNYTTEYLFVKPEHFVNEHFPAFTRHQLLENPVGGKDTARWTSAPEAFKKQSLIKPAFYDAIESLGDCDFADKSGHVTSQDGSYSFSYSLSSETKYLGAVVRDASGEVVENACAVESDGEDCTMHFSFPQAGTYKVRILLYKYGINDNTVVAEFYVDAAQSSEIRYIKLYYPLISISPNSTSLKAGESYDFTAAFGRTIKKAALHYIFEYENDEGKTAEGHFDGPELTQVEDSNIYTVSEIVIPATMVRQSNKETVAIKSVKLAVTYVNDKNEEGTYIDAIFPLVTE